MPSLLLSIGTAIIGGATVSLAVYFLCSRRGDFLRRRYEAQLAPSLDLLELKVNAMDFSRVHFSACVLLLTLGIGTQSPLFLLAIPALGFVPILLLERRVQERRVEIGKQLAPWLTIVSNSLQAAPSILDALASSKALVSRPLSAELARLLREVHFGAPLSMAMERSARRLRSPLYSSVMTTLQVARSTGGDLPKILEQSSASLRELERMAGVVRAKTAEGRSQTMVLALLPFALITGLHLVDGGFLSTLVESTLGIAILVSALTLWLGAVLVARRICQVDV